MNTPSHADALETGEPTSLLFTTRTSGTPAPDAKGIQEDIEEREVGVSQGQQESVRLNDVFGYQFCPNCARQDSTDAAFISQRPLVNTLLSRALSMMSIQRKALLFFIKHMNEVRRKRKRDTCDSAREPQEQSVALPPEKTYDTEDYEAVLDHLNDLYVKCYNDYSFISLWEIGGLSLEQLNRYFGDCQHEKNMKDLNSALAKLLDESSAWTPDDPGKTLNNHRLCMQAQTN
ncbi:hypothetical protein [Candidatus Hepatobacter penaei]|uniref:hypothetical protein n=1 Tax=Candidatus Hepatobacter penaei TaxID=1274402 RepID=UPI0004F33EA3|nr:hypothetical protein [Candidatus Hepatobacter penaei]